MGIIFFIIFMLVLVGIGLSAVIGGIVGLLLLRKRKLRGKVAITVILSLILAFGVLMMAVPVGYVSFLVFVNSTTSEDYVETDIVIEKEGYQDVTFSFR